MAKRYIVDDQFLPCRDYGHTWLPYDAIVSNRPYRIRRILVCGKCSTKRTQTLDGKFDIIGNTYSYPKGYVAVGGRLTASDRAAIRAHSTSMWPTHSE